jgi:hypothetical protein
MLAGATLYLAADPSFSIMAYWKFIASWQTEAECYLRRLFGNSQREIEETGEPSPLIATREVLCLSRQ